MARMGVVCVADKSFAGTKNKATMTISGKSKEVCYWMSCCKGVKMCAECDHMVPHSYIQNNCRSHPTVKLMESKWFCWDALWQKRFLQITIIYWFTFAEGNSLKKKKEDTEAQVSWNKTSKWLWKHWLPITGNSHSQLTCILSVFTSHILALFPGHRGNVLATSVSSNCIRI